MAERYRYGVKGSEPSEDDLHCLKCFYHSRISGYVTCDFILVTGKRRGCAPGVSCKRFLRGDPSSRFHLPDDSVLKPGELPGKTATERSCERNRKRKLRQSDDPVLSKNTTSAKEKVPLDRQAWNELRKNRSVAQISNSIGYNPQTVFRMQRVGVITQRMAALIQQVYGVDVRGK